MEDFLDHILSSSSWPDDVNGTGQPSWVGSTSTETNGLLADPMGIYEGDEKNSSSPLDITSSGSVIGHMPQDDTSILIGGNSNYGLNKGLFREEAQPLDLDRLSMLSPRLDNGSQESKILLHGVIDTSPKSRSSVPLPQSSPQLRPVVGSSAPSLWLPSFSGVSSLPPVMEQGKLQGFGLQGEFVKGGADILGRRFFGDEKLPQLDKLPTSNEQDELHSPRFPSFGSGMPMTLTRAATGLQPHQQLSQSSEANSTQHYTNQSCASQLQPGQVAGGSCNGAVKPRVRARRGQATDPHSIAERLRREKIAERMKNLQELVPNSNKTDKASMLDEIIEYVKFLQLQVKVLSMSRLGAAGAVVPLITDVQSEGSSGLILSASVGQGADLSDSPDNIAFEQEIVKLMESNVTTAMQYLQTKGLCLMPIALAAAISGGKASSNADRKNLTTTHIPVSTNGGPPSAASQPLSSTNENTAREDAASINSCNGSVVKQEELPKSVSDVRESKPSNP
ncbi:uncharacterized protein LOC131251785 [Magnolia sinica]|uniref:uncharacterized protein LOC131251785 n=1 Tax=Magnolia sinica TaxID=86752 RepID=UPI0026588F41|nr:uncharacterized protein LOC131251785 [Magnolia sinica]XP_058108721.1 uncharacterized protein LOC131251785 [Magnolia sinica]XP_058108722.1 uncharacterized protein LOC131251785 [Magnolia sinica]XP_058108723.1 uncharacterized protein LOC131251785 [Magnolia sinica]